MPWWQARLAQYMVALTCCSRSRLTGMTVSSHVVRAKESACIARAQRHPADAGRALPGRLMVARYQLRSIVTDVRRSQHHGAAWIMALPVLSDSPGVDAAIAVSERVEGQEPEVGAKKDLDLAPKATSRYRKPCSRTLSPRASGACFKYCWIWKHRQPVLLNV